MADQVKKQLEGEWIVTRRENLCPYLKELGIPCSDDKLLPTGESKQVIDVDGDVITITITCCRRRYDYTFRIGEEFEIDAGCGIPSKAVAKWEDDGLMIRSVRKGGSKAQDMRRRREGEQMTMTMTTNGVTCKIEHKRRS